jgi:uncharacterized membrane protein YidH (DUF202 family)
VSQSDDDVTRRTRLAAERTWLAWWRSGIAAATAAVGVGGVVPQLVDGGGTAYGGARSGRRSIAVGSRMCPNALCSLLRSSRQFWPSQPWR